MAKAYFDKLSKLLGECAVSKVTGAPIDVKHFFSGAALYANNTICASLTPVGLAFRLAENEMGALIDAGKAVPLKYFPKGHIKRGYVLFENPDLDNTEKWSVYFLKAIAVTEQEHNL